MFYTVGYVGKSLYNTQKWQIYSNLTNRGDLRILIKCIISLWWKIS